MGVTGQRLGPKLLRYHSTETGIRPSLDVALPPHRDGCVCVCVCMCVCAFGTHVNLHSMPESKLTKAGAPSEDVELVSCPPNLGISGQAWMLLPSSLSESVVVTGVAAGAAVHLLILLASL